MAALWSGSFLARCRALALTLLHNRGRVRGDGFR
jgi:hypothetical protein